MVPIDSSMDRLSSPTHTSPHEQSVAHSKRRKPPIVDNITSINDDMLALHQYCVDQGYSRRLIKSAGAPLWLRLSEAKRRRWLNWFILCALIVGIFACVTQCDCLYRLAYAYFRIATIKVLFICICYILT